MIGPSRDPAAPKVVPLEVENAADVVAMAKRFAADLEAGEHGKPVSVAVLLESADGVRVFGWGAADTLRMMGLFHVALAGMGGSKVAE
ncbi:hypothetical protein [Azospirillum sp. ST 5-10]|uniref:hypothetical protein n=1 Tax=unclassified Azospirillum TaxID=2630922 RepID=UPI003F4A3588